jgi:phospholipase C
MPNRAFACAATSQGHLDDKTKSFAVPSIFGTLESHGLGWAIFGYSSDPLTRLNFPDTMAAADSHFGKFADFLAAAASGTLGAFTFLEPSWSSTGNSQHPNYDVALGEQLIFDVYQALRSGPSWSSTLLILTYDEHGGCYDHVAPPEGAVPPDATPGEYGFDFRRFGVRVPTVLVSALIEPGTVFRVPSDSGTLDHTSILATVERRWDLPPLTARDAAAPDISKVVTREVARTDNVLDGVVVPIAKGKNPSVTTPSHLQLVYADLAAQLPGVPLLERALAPNATSAELDAFIDARVEAWKATRSH